MQKGYEWLWNTPGLPKILQAAIALHGTLEAPGDATNNPTILGWGREVGVKRLGMLYSKDSVPWCGLFLSVCAVRAGYEPPPISIRALSWAAFGSPVMRPGEEPKLGDILVFTRKGGGHVGIYVGEDDKAYHVLGGNQKDRVWIDRISKERIYAASRCKWKSGQPATVKRVYLTSDGALSQNEA